MPQKISPPTRGSRKQQLAAMIPLNVLQAAVQTTVELMEVRDQMSAHQETLRAGEKERRAQQLAFGALDRRLDTALKSPAQASEALRVVIARIAEASRREIDRAYDELNLMRKGREIEFRKQVQARCHTLIDALLGQHSLPQTPGDLLWSTLGGSLDAQLATQLSTGLNATFRIAIPHEDLWSKPIRVGELASVSLPELVSWPWSAPKWKERKLDNFFLVSATWGDSSGEIVIVRNPRRASAGYRVAFDARGGVTITPFDSDGSPSEEPRRLDGAPAWGFQQLWMRVTEELATWAHRPRQLVHADLNGEDLSAAPDAVAVAILESIAPQLSSLGAARVRVCDETLWNRIYSLSEPLRQIVQASVRVAERPVAPPPPKRRPRVIRKANQMPVARHCA